MAKAFQLSILIKGFHIEADRLAGMASSSIYINVGRPAGFVFVGKIKNLPGVTRRV
jgi:hypothetical protein